MKHVQKTYRTTDSFFFFCNEKVSFTYTFTLNADHYIDQ